LVLVLTPKNKVFRGVFICSLVYIKTKKGFTPHFFARFKNIFPRNRSAYLSIGVRALQPAAALRASATCKKNRRGKS